MNHTQSLRRMLFALLIAVLTVVGAQAQLSTASLSGTITDPSGAVIPNAKITLTQTDTNFVRVSTSRARWNFSRRVPARGSLQSFCCGPWLQDAPAQWRRSLRHAERDSGYGRWNLVVRVRRSASQPTFPSSI